VVFFRGQQIMILVGITIVWLTGYIEE